MVIGSGIVGAATAFVASRAGISVLVVERRPAPMTVDEETTSHWRPVASGAYLL